MFEEGLLRQFPEHQNEFFHIIGMFLWFGQNIGIYFSLPINITMVIAGEIFKSQNVKIV
jgi:hypothetical protein